MNYRFDHLLIIAVDFVKTWVYISENSPSSNTIQITLLMSIHETPLYPSIIYLFLPNSAFCPLIQISKPISNAHGYLTNQKHPQVQRYTKHRPHSFITYTSHHRTHLLFPSIQISISSLYLLPPPTLPQTRRPKLPKLPL